MKKTFLFLIILSILSTVVLSLDFHIGYDMNISNQNHYNGFNFKIHQLDKNFEFIADASMLNDGKYTWGLSKFFWDYYFFLNNGGIKINFENFNLEFGKLTHADEIKSPYSLFISSKPLPALITNFRYENDSFIYQTRWIRLNHNSSQPMSNDPTKTFPDRGANYQLYALKNNNFRFGFQQSIVYRGTSFHPEFFLNPMPNFLVQYMNNSTKGGAPWTETDANYNSIMGFFADYTTPEYYIYSQILVDDLNANRFLDPTAYQNPDKISWTLGGTLKTKLGNFSLHHAGATKYTYQTSGTKQYSYTYYPDVQFKYSNTEIKTILLEDNYIGYYHGENNIAFMLVHDLNINENLKIASSIEHVISGSKSPVNPWGEYPTWTSPENPGTKLLDEDILEKQYNFLLNISSHYKNIKFETNFLTSYISNKLELTEVPEEWFKEGTNDMKYFSPSNENELLILIRFKIKVNF